MTSSLTLQLGLGCHNTVLSTGDATTTLLSCCPRCLTCLTYYPLTFSPEGASGVRVPVEESYKWLSSEAPTRHESPEVFYGGCVSTGPCH